jgi:LppP/LprE lipoprotein
VRAHGYTPIDSADYHPNQTLAVLVGSRAGAGSQAFFFVDGKFIGTDTSTPSASINVLSQGDTEVTLGYPLYRAQDTPGSPSGGEARVRFQLNDGKLTPLDSIPPTSSSTGLSRR